MWCQLSAHPGALFWISALQSSDGFHDRRRMACGRVAIWQTALQARGNGEIRVLMKEDITHLPSVTPLKKVLHCDMLMAFDGNIKMPMLVAVVYFRRRALFRILNANESCVTSIGKQSTSKRWDAAVQTPAADQELVLHQRGLSQPRVGNRVSKHWILVRVLVRVLIGSVRLTAIAQSSRVRIRTAGQQAGLRE